MNRCIHAYTACNRLANPLRRGASQPVRRTSHPQRDAAHPAAAIPASLRLANEGGQESDVRLAVETFLLRDGAADQLFKDTEVHVTRVAYIQAPAPPFCACRAWEEAFPCRERQTAGTAAGELTSPRVPEDACQLRQLLPQPPPLHTAPSPLATDDEPRHRDLGAA